MDTISMDGVGGVNSVSMHGKVVDGFAYKEGMAVTLTGENEVGPGVSGGSPVFGIVTRVVVYAKNDAGAATDIVLGVQTSGFCENVLMNGTAAVVGDAACCNDKGLLIKAPATLPAGVIRAVVTAVNATAKTATVCL